DNVEHRDRRFERRHRVNDEDADRQRAMTGSSDEVASNALNPPAGPGCNFPSRPRSIRQTWIASNMMFSPRPRVNEPERARIPTAAFPDATPGLYPDSYRRPAPPSIDPE